MWKLSRPSLPLKKALHMPDQENNLPEETQEIQGKPNYNQSFPYSSEGYSAFDLTEETAFMPSATIAETRKTLENLPQTPLGADKNSQNWIGVLNGGITSVPYSDGFVNTTAREEAQFEQTVTAPTGPLHGFTPKFRVREGVKPTGESARFQIRAAMGLGTVFTVPLWHSGFWITLKAPPEGELLELYRKIAAEKVILGRSSYGFMFSNGTSYTSRILLDFVLENMYESSLALKEDEDIREYIRVPDLPLLIWGMACATWPGGFQYQRACISDPEKCKHVVKEKLNLSKLLWTDTTALTQFQIKHMASKQRASMTTDAVKRYVDEFIRGQDSKVEVTPTLSMVLRIPNVTEHIDAGHRWINTIEETYSRALSLEEGSRNDYLLSQGKATAMRQYTHFVKAVEANEQEYDELTVIEETLNDLTADDKIRNKFMEKTRAYLDDSVVSLIAIPSYKCPNCGGEQHHESDLKKHPNLIPLDVTQTFFQLLVQKLRKIEER